MVQTPHSEKNKIFKNRKIKKSSFCHIRACACVCARDEKIGYIPDVNAIKYQMMPFKPIFSPIERTKAQNGIVVRLCLKKWLKTP